MVHKSDIFAADWGSQDELISRLKTKTKVLKSEAIEQAFRSVDRKDFLREGYRVEAYEDYAVPIGEGQTISQPTTVVYMLELLDVESGQRVLDIGSGSGWTTTLLANIVGEEGEVTGVEIKKELAQFGQTNMEKYDLGNAQIRHGDASKEVQPEAPFDRILVSAAAQEAVPDILLDQIVEGGVLVMPVGDTVVKIVNQANEEGDDFTREEHPGFRFVPFAEDEQE